jgi:hypothetical protein
MTVSVLCCLCGPLLCLFQYYALRDESSSDFGCLMLLFLVGFAAGGLYRRHQHALVGRVRLALGSCVCINAVGSVGHGWLQCSTCLHAPAYQQ